MITSLIIIKESTGVFSHSTRAFNDILKQKRKKNRNAHINFLM